MTFPHYFHLLGRPLHPHPVMELLAYTGGFQWYLALRRRQSARGEPHVVPFEQNAWIIVGAVFGALIGSKLLAWAESPAQYFGRLADPRAWMGGKTIVGGLLGGWAGVEIAKRCVGVRQSTGDLFVLPLVVGMAIGRIGCFLTGLDDHTFGVHTPLPWAVDFGDGPRHPTQFYDIAFLALLGTSLAALGPSWHSGGARFRTFMAAYLGYRFCTEFLKPREHPYLGLSAIQWVCLIGGVTCVIQLCNMRRNGPRDDNPTMHATPAQATAGA